MAAKRFEDVKAPGVLNRAAEKKVGCPGILEDEEQRIFWSSMYPLGEKGSFLFFPHDEQGCESFCLPAPNVLDTFCLAHPEGICFSFMMIPSHVKFLKA